MKETWKVSVKQGGYYLIPALNQEKAEARAREVGAVTITGMERHIPKRWPDQDQIVAEIKRSEVARQRLGTRRMSRSPRGIV